MTHVRLAGCCETDKIVSHANSDCLILYREYYQSKSTALNHCNVVNIFIFAKKLIELLRIPSYN
ncbi:hypothetical protein BMS3Abin13_00650 [bacterium BMS3Abin13]|nr:hypothetical protein BMS3Abin13_00650 [bacterium BMS3Abin13]